MAQSVEGLDDPSQSIRMGRVVSAAGVRVCSVGLAVCSRRRRFFRPYAKLPEDLLRPGRRLRRTPGAHGDDTSGKHRDAGKLYRCGCSIVDVCKIIDVFDHGAFSLLHIIHRLERDPRRG